MRGELANKLSNRFTIQFSEEQADQLRALAASRGIGVAPLIRGIVSQELAKVIGDKPVPEVTPE